MIALKPADFRLHFDSVNAALKRVKKKTGERWTAPFVFHRLQDGTAGLFELTDDGKHQAWMVVERYAQGEAPWLNLWILEGTAFRYMDEGLKLVDLLAKQADCVAWRCVGRSGWAKWLKPISTVYERVLT